jgi:hypothetical protein
MISFNNYNFNITREALIRPFHFKGGYFTEKWINILSLETSKKTASTAIGSSAVLWSDPKVFSAYSETGGNIIMAAMAEHAVKLAQNCTFKNPIDALQTIFPQLHKFGCHITGNDNLSKTFTLNTMVSLDLALWKLYAIETGSTIFLDNVPEDFKPAFNQRQKKLAHIPLITYNTTIDEVIGLVDQDHFFLKIKIGQQGNCKEMLVKDKSRINSLHTALKNKTTKHSKNGKLCYYLDANGRYPDKDSLYSLLDYADKIGMLEQIVLLEEPFKYENLIDVSDLPVRVAADESLHSIDDVRERIELGYGAMALKPAGKTLSLTVMMAMEAKKHNLPVFIADSACVPLLVEWNKVTAAHLPSFPGLNMGILESNGAQNYKHWHKLIKDHPRNGASWITPKNGIYNLDSSFFNSAGGIFDDSTGEYDNTVLKNRIQ